MTLFPAVRVTRYIHTNIGTHSLRRWASGMKSGTAQSNAEVKVLGSSETTVRPTVVGYGDQAFQINKILTRQSVLLLPNSFLLWNARTFDDITIESLSIFATIYPTLEILFVGCGEKFSKPLSPEIIKYFRNKGIVVEASSTMGAASTFNLLSEEGRHVAAALLTNQPTSEVAPGTFDRSDIL